MNLDLGANERQKFCRVSNTIVDRSSCFHMICTDPGRALLSQILKEHVVRKEKHHTESLLSKMPWRLEFSNVEQKDLGDLPEISKLKTRSVFFFWQNQCEGSVELVLFHEDELLFLLFKTLIKSSKKSSSGLACKLLICGMDSCRKSWGFSELVALGNKKTSLVPLIFFEAQATEEMWAYIADSMKFVTNSQISDTKVDWSVIYSNLIHLERCKRYTFWTP